ncbi:PTS ascorbate transporter subunit IIB [Erysipelothrix larvae]|uniref:PTS ascorbate transporter subunit IIB n=1 Tax=Erysipelothrix larvae TaxID=1514105 RepID=A0A0X8GYD3_9FIRM|nr:PTS sugar transporter subunit IIB [Erysipelothrix larvae]AMC92707.1 PTS ascorbate transporter subunit IIB [Erysipelothrix larvae]
MKILVACANGSGTSLMLSMTVKKAMKTLGLKITNMHHTSISEGKSSATMYDVVFTSPTFVHLFKGAQEKGVHVIPIQNVMSEQEVIEGLKNAKLA